MIYVSHSRGKVDAGNIKDNVICPGHMKRKFHLSQTVTKCDVRWRHPAAATGTKPQL